MKCASIDIGTNTLRLLLSGSASGGALKPILHKRFITRLGGAFTTDKGIEEGAGERAFKALDEIKKVLAIEAPELVLAVATSVVRKAVNKDWFLKEAKKRLGYDIKVIDGREEARLALRGVISVSSGESAFVQKRLVMDIGGGSTEFIFALGAEIKGSFSMEMGVVHLSEKFLKSDPPAVDEIEALKKAIGEIISDLLESMRKASIDPLEFSPAAAAEAVFVGTAGTVTTLSAIKLGLKEYDPELINGSLLTLREVEEQFTRLKALRAAERLRIDGLEEGREDLIIAGALIVLMAMSAFGFKEMRVCDAGLLEGIILDGLKQSVDMDTCQ